MPEATDATLTRMAESGLITFMRIEAVRETSDARYLGGVGISFRHPIFHAGGISGELSHDSRFVLRKLARPGHETMVFVVFRQFDSSKYSASPADAIAGWVPLEEEDQALRWVQRMNDQIKDFGVTDDDDEPQAPDPPTPAPAAPADAEPIFKSFCVRTHFAGTPEDLVEHVERRLGLRFCRSDHWAYEGQPAFEAEGLGMTIRLVEFPAVASYPRRFNLTGSTESPDGAPFTERRDATGDMLTLLGTEGAQWYVPAQDELNTEAGL